MPGIVAGYLKGPFARIDHPAHESTCEKLYTEKPVTCFSRPFAIWFKDSVCPLIAPTPMYMWRRATPSISRGVRRVVRRAAYGERREFGKGGWMKLRGGPYAFNKPNTSSEFLAARLTHPAARLAVRLSPYVAASRRRVVA